MSKTKTKRVRHTPTLTVVMPNVPYHPSDGLSYIEHILRFDRMVRDRVKLPDGNSSIKLRTVRV